VKPNRSIHDVDAKSVRKKLKDKAFARSVSRDDILNGAAALEVDLDQHIEFCIDAMKQRAAELGLAGTQPAATAAS
jgi:predicted hydrolase (HD superfamily)